MEAVLVGEFVEARQVRVVGGADGVDVQRFHEPQVGDHRRLVQHMRPLRVVLVAVHPAQRERPAVEQELRVADLDAPETDADRRRFERPSFGVEQGQGEFVERRRFRGPGPHRAEGLVEGRRCFAAGLDGRFEHSRRLPYRSSVRVEEAHAEAVRAGISGGGVPDEGGQGEISVPVGVVEIGDDFEVAEVGARTGEQADAPVDPADPPEVLALQVTAVAPAVHLDRQQVRAGAQRPGDAELRRRAAAFAVPDPFTVHEHEEGRVHALEAEEDFVAVPLVGYLEGSPVRADRVVVRGDVRRVGGEGVGLVAIDRVAVAFEFPVRRNRYGVPAGIVVPGLEEVLRAFGGIRRPVEFPGAVEAEEAARFLGTSGQGVFRRRERRETRPGFLAVHGEDRGVLPRRRAFLRSFGAGRDRERPDECGERATGVAEEVGELHRRIEGKGASGGARWPASMNAMMPKSAPQEWKGSLERRSSSPVPVIEE